jgi:hypothetical protein
VARRAVVDHDRVQAAEAHSAGKLDRLEVAALLELGITQQAVDTGLSPLLCIERECNANGEPEPVPERSARDLHAGDEESIGVMAERRVELAEPREELDREETLRREDGIVGRRPVALRKQEPVALGVIHAGGVDVEDPVVEHPEHVERGERAGLVLLVAREQREQLGQIVVADAGCRSHGGHATT